MQGSPQQPSPGGDATTGGDAKWIAVLLAVALPLLLYRLGAKDFWESSEGRPAESAREMREHGDWLVQYTNGQVDLTKPPLYAWLTSLSFRATGGDTEWAARLPSVLASIGVLLLTYRLAKRIAGRRAGLLSALLLLTQARFLWQARLSELETLLALGVLAAYSALASALDADSRAGRARAWALFHLALGFAFAVKGPIALLLVLPGSAAYAIGTRRAQAMLSGSFFATLPIALVVGLAWYLAVVARDGRVAFDTFLAYGAGENVGHLRDPFYYLGSYPLYALPWTPLVLLGFAVPFSRRVERAARTRMLLPFAAFAETFVVLSCLHPKQSHYLIPIFPMGAILAGLWLDRAIAERGAALRRTAAGYSVAIAGLFGFLVATHLRNRHGWSATAGFATGSVVAAAVAIAAARGAWRRPAASLAVVGAWVVLVCGYVLGHHVPSMNREQSSRRFLADAAARVPPGAPLAWTIFGSHSDYLWYLGARVVGRNGIPELVGPRDDTQEKIVARVREFLAAGGRRFALVTGDQADALGGDAVVLARDDAFQRKNRRVALVANRRKEDLR